MKLPRQSGTLCHSAATRTLARHLKVGLGRAGKHRRGRYQHAAEQPGRCHRPSSGAETGRRAVDLVALVPAPFVPVVGESRAVAEANVLRAAGPGSGVRARVAARSPRRGERNSDRPRGGFCGEADALTESVQHRQLVSRSCCVVGKARPGEMGRGGGWWQEGVRRLMSVRPRAVRASPWTAASPSRRQTRCCTAPAPWRHRCKPSAWLPPPPDRQALPLPQSLRAQQTGSRSGTMSPWRAHRRAAAPGSRATAAAHPAAAPHSSSPSSGAWDANSKA